MSDGRDLSTAACKKGQGAETMVGKYGTMEEVELRGRELGREELSTGAFPTLVVKKAWLMHRQKPTNLSNIPNAKPYCLAAAPFVFGSSPESRWHCVRFIFVPCLSL